MQESYDRRKIGRQASWPADLRGTSAGAGAYRTHVGPYHPPSMKRSSRCMPLPSDFVRACRNLAAVELDSGQDCAPARQGGQRSSAPAR